MKRILQIFFLTIYISVLLIPGYTYFFISQGTASILFSSSTETSTKLFTLFRLFGLYAFTLVWSQVMLGTFRLPLSRLYGGKILKYHMTMGLFTFLFAILHPLFFYTALAMTNQFSFNPFPDYLGPLHLYGWLGEGVWFIMLLTVATAYFRTKPFITKYWRTIHYANYLVFLGAFFHSFFIGTETQVDPLKTLYYFFALTFLAGFSYRHILPHLRQRRTIIES